MKTFPIPLPEDLPPAVALALFEALQHPTTALWDQYETEFIELIMAERSRIPATRQSHDFNDDLPFRPNFVLFSPRGRSPLV